MNKKVVTILGIGMAAMAMSAPAVFADDQITLVYSDANSIDSADGMYATYFKEKVEEMTGGSVTIDIQPSGVLGNESEVLDGMISMSGTVDMERVSCYALSNYGCKKSALLGLPFLFESREHFWNFANSDLGAELLAEPSESGLGVQALFYLEDGFRSFFFSDEVSGIDDLKNKKLRVSQDQIMTGLVEGLGASPTVVSFNELYTSLQSGVVDGAEQPIPQYESNAFNEVSPYMLLDEHTMATSYVIITDDAMMKLSEEQQAAVKEAGKLTEEYCAGVITELVNNSMDSLTEKGVTFIPVEDKAPYREACTDVISKFTNGVEDVYQGILDLAK